MNKEEKLQPHIIVEMIHSIPFIKDLETDGKEFVVKKDFFEFCHEKIPSFKGMEAEEAYTEMTKYLKHIGFVQSEGEGKKMLAFHKTKEVAKKIEKIEYEYHELQ